MNGGLVCCATPTSSPGVLPVSTHAVSACKALTVVWYAKRKGIPVEDVQVHTERDASEERHGTYRLAATLHLTCDLSEAQREELLAIAQKCPIHRLMTAVTTEITTVLG